MTFAAIESFCCSGLVFFCGVSVLRSFPIPVLREGKAGSPTELGPGILADPLCFGRGVGRWTCPSLKLTPSPGGGITGPRGVAAGSGFRCVTIIGGGGLGDVICSGGGGGSGSCGWGAGPGSDERASGGGAGAMGFPMLFFAGSGGGGNGGGGGGIA